MGDLVSAHLHEQLERLSECRDGLLRRLLRARMFHPTLAVPITLLDRACMVSVIGIAIAYRRGVRTRLVGRPVKRYTQGQGGRLALSGTRTGVVEHQHNMFLGDMDICAPLSAP